jgi:HSP20 family molecular chaperone IbpA
MKRKRSFFEKLTGTTRTDEFDYEEEERDFDEESSVLNNQNYDNYETDNRIDNSIGELSVDVINTPNEIIIKAMVAGVRPQDLDVQISRDMVTIEGKREDSLEIDEQDYYHRELYWGSFARNILLPEEIDVESSEAREKNGMLEIHLPKIDKTRKAKLQVKSS